MRNKYQREERKSNHKFEVVGGQELMVRVPLPMAEVWAEMQAQMAGASPFSAKEYSTRGVVRMHPESQP